MYVAIIVLTVIVAVLLIGIVLIQKSKGGGLSSQFGGAGNVMGVRQTNSFLEKTTWTLAALIVVLSIASAYTMPKNTSAQVRTVAPAATQLPAANQFDQQAPAEAPVATPAEAE